MKGVLSALLALWLMTPVQAQTTYPFVVSSCGSQTFTAGQSKPVTMDTTGNLCTSAVGGGGSSAANQGTANTAANAWPVTLVIGGAVNAVGNPIFVSPGTGASFAVTGTFFQATQPVSLASLPSLATGTNTIGKVDILGNAGGTLDTAAGSPASTGLSVQGFGSAGTASGGVVTVQGVASMTKLLVTPDSVALPANQSVNVNQIAGASIDPCFGSSKSYADFESGTSGGSIITAVSSKKAYVCAITIVTSAAANVSVIEGTGSSVCTGGTTAGDYLNTGVTAANGAAFAANAGVTFGSGIGTLFANATANQNTCIAFTTTNSPQVNVHVAYVQQ